MPHSKLFLTPEEVEAQNGAISDAEVYEFAEQRFNAHSRGATFILQDLVDHVRQFGYFHGRSAVEVAEAFHCCVSEIMTAARYLQSCGVIDFDISFAKGEQPCTCEYCEAQRSWMRLRFDIKADREAALQNRRAMADAERERQQQTGHARQSIRKPTQRHHGFVYLLKCSNRYKIGVTTDLDRRLAQLNGRQAAFPIELIHHVTGPDYQVFERKLHDQHTWDNVHGEWFEFDAETVAAVIEEMNIWAVQNSPSEGGE